MARILIFCSDVVAKTMAGPGIRYWEFAKALSRKHDVTLAAPNKSDLISSDFKIITHGEVKQSLKNGSYDFLITQFVTFGMSRSAKRSNTKIIVDAYGPVILEELENYSGYSSERQRKLNKRTYVQTMMSFQNASAVICACNKQRDLWLGLLMSQDRLQPGIYEQDHSLRNLIDIVPFGMEKQPPKKTGEGFRKKFGIKNSDKVVIWGGGIWNWFDPLTLIRAMDIIKKKDSNIKLVFMCTKHPNENIKELKMTGQAVNLAKKLDLYDNTVFFNYGWVPYEDRANYFLEADFGVSTHFDHLETRFSFRTRMLDYLWADLPIIATKGDTFADLIEKENLGTVVDYRDVEGLATAIEDLASDTRRAEDIKSNIAAIKRSYSWDQVVEPLEKLIVILDKSTRRKLPVGQSAITLKSLSYRLSDIKQKK